MGGPSNVEQRFVVELADNLQSCDEASPEFRELKLEAFDETGAELSPGRTEYQFFGTFPHTSTRLFNVEYWFSVQRGGDYLLRASFPDGGWPDINHRLIVPQHQADAPVVTLPQRCESVGSVGPDTWLCDGALFRGSMRMWVVPEAGRAISRATEGVAWVHGADGGVYRFEGDVTNSVQAIRLGRRYEALTATATELFLQSPSGLARVTFHDGGLTATEADFAVPLSYVDEFGMNGLGISWVPHGVQVSPARLATIWMSGRMKVKACRWSLPESGLPPLVSADCIEESSFLTGVGTAGAWIFNRSEFALRDFTTSLPTTLSSRPYGTSFIPDQGLYLPNRRWHYASAHPTTDGSIDFDAWDIPLANPTDDEVSGARWDAEDDLAWVACRIHPPGEEYTFVWRRPTTP